METNENSTERRILRLGFKMLRLGGLHPTLSQAVPSALKRLMLLPPLICFAISCQQLFFGKKDLDSFAENVQAVGDYALMLVCMYVCQFDQAGLKALLREEEGLWGLARVSDGRVREDLAAYLGNAENVCKLLAFLVGVLVAMLNVVSIFVTDLPIGTHNFDNELYYHFYLYMQVICTCHIALYGIAILVVIFCGSIITLIVQYKIVEAVIGDLKINIGLKDWEELQKHFTDIVEFHIYLRRYTKILRDVYSPVLAVTLISGVAVLCTHMYSALEKEVNAYLLKLVFMAVLVLSVYNFIAFLSEELHSAELSIGDAWYAIPWYDMEHSSTRKFLVILISRAQQPVPLEAMGLFQINAHYIITVLKVAYSAMNILRAVQANGR